MGIKRWEPENTFLGYNMKPTEDGSFVLFENYQSDVVRLQEKLEAEKLTVKLLKSTGSEVERILDGVIADRDALKADIERLEFMVNSGIQTNYELRKERDDAQYAMQSENLALQEYLTKARELLRHIDSDMPHSFRDGWKAEVDAFLAHQSVPAAKGG